MNKQLTFLLVLTFLFLFSGSVYGEDSINSPKFHFKEDEKIVSKKNLYDEIKPTDQGSLVNTYNSLNVPLTILNYINIELDHKLNDLKEVWTDYAEEHFENNSQCDNLFDPFEGWDKVTCHFNEFFNKDSNLRVKIKLRYMDELKRVQLAVFIDGLGKPKKPMKSFCLKILKMTEHNFSWIVSDVTQKITSVVAIHTVSSIDSFYVSALSSYPVDRGSSDVFAMECVKSDLSKEIIYNKNSFKDYVE